MNRRKKGWTVVLAALAAVAVSMPVAATYTVDLTDRVLAAGGAATASSAYDDPLYGNLAADRAFDNGVSNYDTYWGSGQTVDATHPEWIRYDFGYGGGPPRVISRYRIHTGPPDGGLDGVTHSWYIPDDWTFEGSDDGTSWTVLHTAIDTGLTLNAWSPYYDFANLTAYRYYQIHITDVETGWGGTYVDISEIEMMAEGYVVSGTVTDGTNPVPGVAITFSHDGHTETTAADGTYYYAVAVGATTTITPSHAGYDGWSPASRTINNLAADAPNQDFVGTPKEPEINVEGNGQSIPDGDTSPTTADHTDFGDVNVGSDFDRTFTIRSIGDLPLDLTGSPYVTFSSNPSGDFSVTVQPTTDPIASGGSDTFTIQCNPSGTGARTATVSIANNDSDENPYNFDVKCTGVAQEIDVKRGAASIADGGTDAVGNQAVGTVNLTYTIANIGTADLTVSTPTASNFSNVSGFSVTSAPSSPVPASGSTTFTIQFNVDTNGAFSLDADIASNDADENPYDIQITGTGAGGTQGDVDNDGHVDVIDARLCLQIAQGIITGTPAQRAAADVDGDGDVDETDAQILSEFVLGIRKTLP